MNSISSGEGRSSFAYLSEYVWQVLLNFFVGKPQNMYATLRQKFGTLCIMCRLLRIEVNATVHFDGQLTFDTEEIENKLAVGMLSSEFEASQLPLTQRRPQSRFCRSLLLTQAARSIDYLSCCFTTYRPRHDVLLLPSPANAFCS
jgi:hypothetical protein